MITPNNEYNLRKQAHEEKAFHFTKLKHPPYYKATFLSLFKTVSSLAPPNLLSGSEVSEVQQLEQKQGLKQFLWRKPDSSSSP